MPGATVASLSIQCQCHNIRKKVETSPILVGSTLSEKFGGFWLYLTDDVSAKLSMTFRQIEGNVRSPLHNIRAFNLPAACACAYSPQGPHTFISS